MTAYPYIPNALPEIQQRMLREIGLDSIDQLYDVSDSVVPSICRPGFTQRWIFGRI